MPTDNGYRAGWTNDDDTYRTEKSSSDAEYGQPRSSVGYKGKEDPFGDESKSEVKYRTMAWW